MPRKHDRTVFCAWRSKGSSIIKSEAARLHALVHQKVTSEIIITYNTKLKLDKEVGGGDLSDLCTNVVSCKSIQFPNFRVQAKGYAIKYVMLH